MRLRILASTLLVALILIMIVSSVHAQEAYAQRMTEVQWTSKTILVSVPSTPNWAYSEIGNAMRDWNQAQTWFLQKYEPNHLDMMYTLQETSGAGQVTVSYRAENSQQWDGQTSRYGKLIEIVISRFSPNGNKNLEVLTEHELGHVLGLADNCVTTDLLYGGCLGTLYAIGAYYPSTLDLYAAYVQVKSGNALTYDDTVVLPPQIPYMAWSPVQAVTSVSQSVTSVSASSSEMPQPPQSTTISNWYLIYLLALVIVGAIAIAFIIKRRR